MSSNPKKTRKVPSALAHWLEPSLGKHWGRKPGGLVNTGLAIDEQGPVEFEFPLFGEAESNLVEEALLDVQRADRHVQKLEQDLRSAREDLSGKIKQYGQLVDDLDRYLETGVRSDALKPRLDRMIKTALAADRRKAKKRLKWFLPAAVYIAMSEDGYRLKQHKVDEHNEYVTIYRRRVNPLTKAQMTEFAHRSAAAVSYSDEPREISKKALNALLVARANIEELWALPESTQIENEKLFDVRQELLNVTGEFEVVAEDGPVQRTDGNGH